MLLQGQERACPNIVLMCSDMECVLSLLTGNILQRRAWCILQAGRETSLCKRPLTGWLASAACMLERMG